MKPVELSAASRKLENQMRQLTDVEIRLAFRLAMLSASEAFEETKGELHAMIVDHLLEAIKHVTG
jgi:hypothetical protein